MAATNGRGPKRQKPGPPPGPYQPSPRDLQIYAALAEGRTSRDVGNKFHLSHVRVLKIRDQVDEWLLPQYMEQIRQLRVRHSESLMTLYRKAVDGFNQSQEDAVTETVKTGGRADGDGEEHTRQRKGQAGQPAFLAEARHCLSEIRRIWGADTSTREESSEGEDIYSGRSRDEAIRLKIERLTKALRPSDN